MVVYLRFLYPETRNPAHCRVPTMITIIAPPPPSSSRRVRTAKEKKNRKEARFASSFLAPSNVDALLHPARMHPRLFLTARRNAKLRGDSVFLSANCHGQERFLLDFFRTAERHKSREIRTLEIGWDEQQREKQSHRYLSYYLNAITVNASRHFRYIKISLFTVGRKDLAGATSRFFHYFFVEKRRITSFGLYEVTKSRSYARRP